jgi:hypothetical protein
MKIAIVDGQGGGIGAAIIRRIREVFGEEIELWALGTNAIATSQMMKAGANRGATGENAVCHCAGRVDAIAGPIAVLIANAMMGEITLRMVEAIGSSPALKLLLPLTQEPLAVVGAVREPLPHLVEKLVTHHLSALLAREASQQCR